MADRRDNKNRKLWTGESQDKDGRYVYKYTDSFGQRKALYSWRLTETDATPKGKRRDISLREKEKQLQKDINDGIIANGGNITVLELVKKYIGQKKAVRHNTMANYNFVINVIAKEEFGQRRIDKVKLSDAKEWLIKLQSGGRGYSSIHTIRGVVRPAFQMALDDDLIRKNPFEFQLSTVVVNDSVTREAITRKQERQFLEFIKKDSHFSKYYGGIYILFKTGLRISEFCGLTAGDIDFENHCINVGHQLQRKRNMEYIIEETKTESGTRLVPMTADVEKYNSIYKVQLPPITPHVARHTFCSNMAKSGMNPKTLQKIMGHSDIGVTLNTYTHVDFEDMKTEMYRVCNG